MSNSFGLVDEDQLPDGYAVCDNTHTLFDQLTCAECGSKALLEAQRAQTLRDVVAWCESTVGIGIGPSVAEIFTHPLLACMRELGIEV